MLRKKVVYTIVTPIPSHIPRQLCIDILQSHSEIITLNPLVINHKAIPAPRNAEADEYYSTWYEIEERMQWIPGAGKLGSGKIKFNGCFHNMPWGLQTHNYCPGNVDLRVKYRICGNQPGEPPQARELGINAPSDGLYLREDIEIKCNIAIASYVKKEMQGAAKVLVERFIKKAELIDSGELQAMMENGRLKTVNPADRSNSIPQNLSVTNHNSLPPPPPSPYQNQHGPPSPMKFPMPSYGQHPYYQQHQQYQQQAAPMELPGDTYHAQTSPSPSYLQPQGSPYLRPSSTQSGHTHQSHHSTYSANGQWPDYQSQASSRPSSYTSDNGLKSPGMEHKSFSSELPAMKESREEYDPHHAAALQHLESGPKPVPPPKSKDRYSAQDFAAVYHANKAHDYQ